MNTADENRESAEGRNKKKRISSQDLFAGCREVIIDHESWEYRLIITKGGKLLLTK